jgi:hypothetical protein
MVADAIKPRIRIWLTVGKTGRVRRGSRKGPVWQTSTATVAADQTIGGTEMVFSGFPPRSLDTARYFHI